jgi:homogentisate 1,2-dioxygenase
MPHYRQIGSIPRHRHTVHTGPAGEFRYEELMGEEGFSSNSALLYHRHVPSALVGSRTWELPDQTLTAHQPLLPRHLRPHALFAAEQAGTADAVRHRRLLLGNGDVRISYVVAGADSPLYKNAIGDELVYVERGEARVETQLGAFDVGQGDYVLIPRAVIHRWVAGAEPARLYVVEASGHIHPPKRYLSKYGQFLEHSPYCERDLRVPTEPLLAAEAGDEEGHVEVFIKHRGRGPGGVAGTVHLVPHHPFDVVGWDGCLYPYVFNIRDYMPLTGKVHQPPPAHQVFEGPGFVVCNFVPRKVDYHERAIPVPYYHSNVDSDEVMFYVDGDYEARKGSGIGQGSISLHPGGHAHGPQPGAMEASVGKDYFDETAVMVDTFRPLDLGEGGLACDDVAYAASWSGGRWVSESPEVRR